MSCSYAGSMPALLCQLGTLLLAETPNWHVRHRGILTVCQRASVPSIQGSRWQSVCAEFGKGIFDARATNQQERLIALLLPAHLCVPIEKIARPARRLGGEKLSTPLE